MLAYSKQALIAFAILASAGMATADDKVEMSLSSFCHCSGAGGILGADSKVFAAAVVEVPRSSVEGKSLEQLRLAMDARQYRALLDAARSTCQLKASRAQAMQMNKSSGDLGMKMMVGANCGEPVDIRIGR